MKWILLTALLALSFSDSDAQYSYNISKLIEDQVPGEVVNSFKGRFNDATVVRWEKHTGKGSLKTREKYVVIFDQAGIRSRARYKPDGTGISASSYYLFKRLENLPSAVHAYAKSNYPDYRLGSGEKILSLKNSQYAYRIRLRKGSSLVVIYLNEQGEKLTKNNLSEELVEDEGGNN